jgi:hypothetical protein
VRVNVFNRRILKLLASRTAATVPRSALSGVHLVHGSRLADTSVRKLVNEVDPDDNGDCLSLGALVFRTDNGGPPNVGVPVRDSARSDAMLAEVGIGVRIWTGMS